MEQTITVFGNESVSHTLTDYSGRPWKHGWTLAALCPQALGAMVVRQ